MISKIYLNDMPLDIISFSGGEVQIVVPDRNYIKVANHEINTVTAHIKCNSGILALAQLKNILDHSSRTPTVLILPYVPYSRYDRRMKNFDSQSLKVFCNILNSLKFSSISIADPHSDVAENLIDNVYLKDQLYLLNTFYNKRSINISDYSAIVAPDLGASKKIQKIAEHYKIPIIQCNKKRDLSNNGRLLSFEIVSQPEVFDKVLIVDDICDGGGTFIGISKLLKEAGAEFVDLYTTHGIYSKGVEPLLEEIRTVRSFYSWIDNSKIDYETKY